MIGIADLVARLIAAGTPPELAAVVVTEAFAAGVASRNSTGIPVDEAAERRRAYDRDRKRLKAEILRKSAENPQNSAPALNLTSSPLKDSEVQKEGKKVRARKAQLSAEWQPKPSHFEAGERRKMPRSAVLEKADDMRLWAKSKGEPRADWDATFHGFIRRDAAKFTNSNGAHHEQRSVLAAFDRLEQSLAGGDDNAPRESDLLSLPPR